MANYNGCDTLMYESEIFNELYDLMEYNKRSILFENLDVFKINNFFNEFIYFDLDNTDESEEEYDSLDEFN